VPSRPTVIFGLAAAADIALAASGRDRLRRLTKPFLMPTLLLNRDRSTQRALALGWVGDVALLGADSERYGPAAFTAGLSAFLAGHVAWIEALRSRPSKRLLRDRPALTAPYVVAWAGLNAYLWPRTGRDRVPVLVYSAALTAMALTALDTGKPSAAAGGMLFLASDTLLALKRFAGVEVRGGESFVMATYVASQALLADGSQVPRPG
jgi:uncharacterized membrane protein YhhN